MIDAFFFVDGLIVTARGAPPLPPADADDPDPGVALLAGLFGSLSLIYIR